MELNQEQRKAITAFIHNRDDRTNPLQMCVAGAGAGKTRVLVGLVKALLQGDVSPYEVMVFTFTRKAATELVERLETEIGTKAFKLRVGTMHSIGLQFIKENYHILQPNRPAPTVYNDWEENLLLREVAGELGFYNEEKRRWKKIKKRVLDAFMAHYYNTGDVAFEPDMEQYYDVWQALTARCRENNAMTYGALLLGWKLLIHQAHYPYRYVLVDEAQDLNLLQWKVIQEMEAFWKTRTFAVGDVDQCIYEWRGASPNKLIDYSDLGYPVHYLNNNYRNSPRIITMANMLIDNNVIRFGEKKMNPMRDHDGPIQHIVVDDTQDFAIWMNGNQEKIPKSTAVLCRVRRPLEKLHMYLDELHFHHHYVGQTESCVRSEPFRKWLAWAKLLANNYDNFEFMLLTKTSEDIDQDLYTQIRLASLSQFDPHLHTYLKRFASGDTLDFFEHQDETDKIADVAPIISSLCSPAIGFDVVARSIQPVIEHYILNVNSAGTVADFLDWVAMIDLQEDITAEHRCVQLMTIHGAKGLEFDTVFILHFNEGFLPSRQAKNMDEERRLAYVAMTRAERQLFAVRRTGQAPSRFMAESGFPND